MKSENKLIKILEKYDFIRPVKREVVKFNIASKSRVYKKILKQNSRWSFGSGYAYSIFSALRNFGFSVNMSSSRRFARISLVAASFIIIITGTLTITGYLENHNNIGRQSEIADNKMIIPLSGVISFVTGDVQIEDAGGNQHKAVAGDTVTANMKISTTGKKSVAERIVYGAFEQINLQQDKPQTYR